MRVCVAVVAVCLLSISHLCSFFQLESHVQATALAHALPAQAKYPPTLSQKPHSPVVDSVAKVSLSTRLSRVSGRQGGQAGAPGPLGLPVLAKFPQAACMAADRAASAGVKEVKLGTLWNTKGSSLAWHTSCAHTLGRPKVGKMEALL